MTPRKQTPPRRPQTPPRRSTADEAERMALGYEAQADGTYGHLRSPERRAYLRVIAEGFRDGALLPLGIVWNPREHPGTPPPAWIDQHRAVRSYAAARLEAEDLELPTCRACGGRYCG